MYTLAEYIMKTMETVQAAAFDQNIQTLRELLSSGDVNFLPTFLHEINLILEITVRDVITLRETLKQTSEETESNSYTGSRSGSGSD